MVSFATLLLAVSGIFLPSERIPITVVEVRVTVPGSRLFRCPCADPHRRLTARRHWQIRGKQGTNHGHRGDYCRRYVRFCHWHCL